MTLEILLSLAGMAFAASLTPGPNNSMLASSGATYGIRASMPHVLGIILGFPVMIYLVGLGLGEVFRQNPELQQIMRFCGALMMLWFAWKIANASAPGSTDKATRPLTFLQSAAFQWINPKGWLAAIAVTSQFVTTEAPISTALTVSLVFVVAGICATMAWLVFGRTMGRWLHTSWRLRAFNLTMALMLIGFLALILLG